MTIGICQDCHTRGKIIIHHKDENYDNDVASNRKALCYRCHLVAHGRADRGTGERSEHIPIDTPFPLIEGEEVRRQYFACFPRA